MPKKRKNDPYWTHLIEGGKYERETGRGTGGITNTSEGYLVTFSPLKRLQRYHRGQVRVFSHANLIGCISYLNRIMGNPPTALHYLVSGDDDRKRVFPEGASVPGWKKREMEKTEK